MLAGVFVVMSVADGESIRIVVVLPEAARLHQKDGPGGTGERVAGG
ncbi:hypothetical protein HMPREF9440_02087 [Sutterella parvirubra YIT 11816]|uniref:Uncharacterized protein n=1 Tax=Sutterella parvirubra YIT 11816 TaxID=762967 RepID=H3KH46_9BURK|nr:hypothetical protein HMPREF9440_02087 [Sutterella parvirubra YIT 11816]